MTCSRGALRGPSPLQCTLSPLAELLLTQPPTRLLTAVTVTTPNFDSLCVTSPAVSWERMAVPTEGSGVSGVAPIERLDAQRFKIEELLDRVREGRVRIPRFQRGLRWTASDVEKLFDSIYRGFPIGTLLFWQRPASADRVEIGPIVVNAPHTTDALWVVDGQQRVTSLAASLLPIESGSPDPRFELAFDLVRETFVRNRAAEDRDTWLPLRSAYDLQRVLPWLRERRLPQELEDRAYRLADSLRNYEIPAYVVKAQDERALRQIFDRTNTFGKRMTRAEVFHALNTSTDTQPADLRALSEEVAASGYGELDDNTLLFCVLGVRHPDVLRDFHSEFADGEDVGDAFHSARRAIADAASFLTQYAGVPHLGLVPYQHLTVGLVRFFALHPESSEWERTLLRRWFWRSAVHGPIARLGSTGTLRATTKAIVPEDAQQSVAALLELDSPDRREPELVSFRWNVADVRTSICALADLGPLDAASGEKVDVAATIERLGRGALVRVVPTSTDELSRTLANRMFQGVEEFPATGDVGTAVSVADEATLRSHAIPEEAAAALRGGDAEEFLRLRADALRAAVASFVDARAEWERPTRPEISQLRFAEPREADA